jgi:hypothetical protein
VFSTWSWDVFNVPERIALALASQGSRVLYCEMPVSRFRRCGTQLSEIEPRIHRFGPEYLGAKINNVPIVRGVQWKMVAKQVLQHVEALRLKDPLFAYSHIDRITPLCEEMRSAGFPLVHICMDYPEAYQYELIAMSDRTLVIPKAVFHKLRAKYGEKVQWIPQSIHLPAARNDAHPEPAEFASIPRPRLGYPGPIFARLNLGMLREVLTANPQWHFVYFGHSNDLPLSNAHEMGWRPPEELPRYVAAFDAGIMPYDCFEEKNLHCSPLKLYDYFLAGTPVVATPILELLQYQDLIYFGESAREFAGAIEDALQESPDSAKRLRRMEVARAHSTEALGRRLEEVLRIFEKRSEKAHEQFGA